MSGILFHENIVTIQVRYFDYDEAPPEEIERDFRSVLEHIIDESDGDEVISLTVERTGNQRLYGEESP